MLLGAAVIIQGNVKRPFAMHYSQVRAEQKEAHSFRDLVAYISQKYEFKNKSNLQNFYFQQRFNSSEVDEAETVRDYLLAIPAKTEGIWTLEKVLDLLALRSLEHESLLKLSNGESRRLAIAAGLLRQPKLFLMDHPTTGLDVQSREHFDEILKQIITAGTHVLMTCHPHEVPKSITHVAALTESGIRWSGPREQMTLERVDLRSKGWDWDKLSPLLPDTRLSEEELIRLEKVRISYGDKVILKEISWQVRSGECWLLKGRNGSGKSTLISLLIGEHPQAYSQQIWLFGRKRGTGESIWDIKRPTGFVAPELVRFFPRNQTCRKVILSGLYDTMGLFKKVSPEQEELGSQWIRAFGLKEVADTPIHRLAIDQQRWTLLARALIKKPKLLILDEASQGLDDLQRRLFKETIQFIYLQSEITLIYVSHYDTDVPEVVNRVLELS